MRDHDESAQAEQVGAAVRFRIEPAPQLAGRRADQEPSDLAARGRLDRLAQAADGGRDSALERLQGHVPGEAVADDHVGRAVQEVAALDVPDEAKRARLEQRMGFTDELVALLRLLADREERDGRALDLERVLGEDGAHVGELEQVLGARVGVGARVEQHARAVRARERDRDRRTMDSGKPADLDEPRGQESAGVAGRERHVGLALLDGATGREERAVALGAHGVPGLLVHLDLLVGVDDLESARERLDDLAPAVEDRLDGVAARLERARDDLLRRPVAAHRVHRDPDGRHRTTEPASREARPRGRDRCHRSGRRGAAAWADGTAGTP